MRLIRLPALAPAVLALTAFVATGCAELRAPRVTQPVPVELLPPGQDPMRAAIRLAANDFSNQGVGLRGRPAETAGAIARLEWLTAVISTDPRYRALPVGLGMSMRAAALETRQALGMVEDTPPALATRALTDIAQALEEGRTPQFPAEIFPAGPERSLQRLRAPEPFPQAAIATGQLAEVSAALDRSGGWNPDAGDPRL
ncbi:hypothetical protein HMPREF9946_03854 [Acetobacteraceae bacterium AT-5844]|nr:hypothetical protein HMPREF9946_03854 [Acetobacteraceae bacterium AT-5844]